jgi:phospholipase/lecithinase/hemolysin
MNPFRTMPGGAVTALLLLGACCTAAASSKTMQNVREKPSIDEIVMFGDSYEDDGALLRLTKAAVKANIPEATLIPGAPEEKTYWKGRWSNGPTLVEVLARSLEVPLVNYAIGGAKSGEGNYYAWLDYVAESGLAGQIDSYGHDLGASRAHAHAIYMVSASTNDYCQFHDFHQPGRLPVGDAAGLSYEDLADRAARNVRAAVERLAALGARRIVVFSSYPVGQSPLATTTDPQVSQANRFTGRFDEELRRELKLLKPSDAKITIFPIAGLIRSILRSPLKYGIANTSQPCQPTVPKPGTACAAPDSYVWWDELHPTAQMHRLLGKRLAEHIGITAN